MLDTNARAALAARQERIARALTERDECFARVRRMRADAHLARQIRIRPFPYPNHRTVADHMADLMAEAREEQVRRAIRRGLGR